MHVKNKYKPQFYLINPKDSIKSGKTPTDLIFHRLQGLSLQNYKMNIKLLSSS